MPKRRREREGDLDFIEAPTSINPYETLAVPQSASQDDIKRAYRKAALKHHPDKAAPEDKDAAHTLFQEIAFAFAILSDERRRKRYDATGSTEEILDLEDDDFNWTDYYREQFAGVINEAAINKFADEYKGSEEERGHVLKAYVGVKGRMESLYSRVMLSDMVDDEERFRVMIDKAIKEGEVESFKDYTDERESTRQKRLDRAQKRKEKESKQADEAVREVEKTKAKKAKTGSGDADLGDLAALIQQRQKGRSANFFDNLEAKYAPKGQKGKSKALDEPPDEAFAANRSKISASDAVEGAVKSGRRNK